MELGLSPRAGSTMGVGHGALELMAWKANIMSIVSGLNDHRQTAPPPPPASSSFSRAYSVREPFPATGTGTGSINHPSPIKLVHWLDKVMPMLPQARTQFPDAESMGTRAGRGQQSMPGTKTLILLPLVRQIRGHHGW